MLLDKKIVWRLPVLSLLTVIMTACSMTGRTAVPSGPSVQMEATTFSQSPITIKKGDHLSFVNSSPQPHHLMNGMWDGETAKPRQEVGAPRVALDFKGGEEVQNIGPFQAAGAFKLYCTLHPGMNLTIIVT